MPAPLPEAPRRQILVAAPTPKFAATQATAEHVAAEAEYSSREIASNIVPPVEELTLPHDLFGAGSLPPSPEHRRRWIVATVLLVLMLPLQALYFFGTQLAASNPELRPQLTSACRWLHCKIALPRLPEQLFIEASDLQVLDPAHPSEILLTVTVRNRAPTRQDLPLIELTLTDGTNQTAARKVFYPTDYGDGSDDLRNGIGANQEIPIKLYLDTGDIRAAGYRLYLFFA